MSWCFGVVGAFRYGILERGGVDLYTRSEERRFLKLGKAGLKRKLGQLWAFLYSSKTQTLVIKIQTSLVASVASKDLPHPRDIYFFSMSLEDCNYSEPKMTPKREPDPLLHQQLCHDDPLISPKLRISTESSTAAAQTRGGLQWLYVFARLILLKRIDHSFEHRATWFVCGNLH